MKQLAPPVGVPITILAVALSWIGTAISSGGDSISTPAILPRPARLEVKSGSFRLDERATIVAREGTEDEAKNLANSLRTETSLAIPLGADSSTNKIILELDPSLERRVGLEGYQLSITTEAIRIRAAKAAGLFYGGVTLRQLLPMPARLEPMILPCLEIEDQPAFAWRGLLLDPARHFMPPEFIRKFIDVMALHKLNTLQLHLTDDQGWRLEIRKYPRLTEIGSVRKESPRRGARQQGDGLRYGPFYYTQAEMRELVAYARARHVTIVPEIELPGHFCAAIAAYPEFSCRGEALEVRTRWGIEPDILCPGNDAAVAFARDILDEVCAVFPSRFIHIGGDEAPRERWKQCPKCQARMKAEGFSREAQLQTWLNARLEAFLAAKGRRLIGWDEILEGGLTPGATVMSWRGTAGGLAAAEAGHDVVMSPTTHCYFDYAQGKGPNEPESIGGFVPLKTVYAFDPLPKNLAPAKRHHVLGAQGNIWTEYIWTPAEVEYFAYPRASALAEVVWSGAEQRDYADFLNRLQRHLRRLDPMQVNYRRLDPPR